jgi:DNA-dependent RNA polymerase auxiliary subunit epsilon
MQTYNHCNACRNFKYKHGFTLTFEDREKLNNEPWCHICGSTERLHIDHDHNTNKVRHYLCYSCNYKLGWFEKNSDQIYNYLQDNEPIN